MAGENKDNINLTELLINISTNVATIKADMQSFKDSYKSEKENLLAKIDDVRCDCEKELQRQDAVIKQLTVYVEAIRTSKDKEDAKKWRTVIAFILTGVGGLLIGCIPAVLKIFIQMGAN